EVVIYFVTLAVIVAEDLLLGVIVGVLLSAAKLLYVFSHLSTRIDYADEGRRTVLHLYGAATFVRLPVLAAALDRIAFDTNLRVDFEHLQYIDHACLELLTDRARQMELKGGTMTIDWDSLHAKFQASNGSKAPPPIRDETQEVVENAVIQHVR